MNVAVAAAGTDLNAPTDPRFGRCQYFVLVNTDTMAFEAVSNAAAMQGSGAGIAAVQLVADAGAEAVIAANLGPNAFQALSAGGLKIYAFENGTVGQAVEALKAGQLMEIGTANVPSHYGMGGGGGAAQPGAGGGAGQPGGGVGFAGGGLGPGGGGGRGAGRGCALGMGRGMGMGMGRGMGMCMPGAGPGALATDRDGLQAQLEMLQQQVAAVQAQLANLEDQGKQG